MLPHKTRSCLYKDFVEKSEELQKSFFLLILKNGPCSNKEIVAPFGFSYIFSFYCTVEFLL